MGLFHFMATIKVRGGTVSDGSRLCDSCRFCSKILGSRPSEEYLQCGAISAQITWQVSFCSIYEQKGQTSLFDMRMIAWPLSADKKGN
jgi:hypothetical protein